MKVFFISVKNWEDRSNTLILRRKNQENQDRFYLIKSGEDFNKENTVTCCKPKKQSRQSFSLKKKKQNLEELWVSLSHFFFKQTSLRPFYFFLPKFSDSVIQPFFVAMLSSFEDSILLKEAYRKSVYFIAHGIRGLDESMRTFVFSYQHFCVA